MPLELAGFSSQRCDRHAVLTRHAVILLPRPNPSFQGTAGKLRLPVRSGLRPTPAPELKR